MQKTFSFDIHQIKVFILILAALFIGFLMLSDAGEAEEIEEEETEDVEEEEELVSANYFDAALFRARLDHSDQFELVSFSDSTGETTAILRVVGVERSEYILGAELNSAAGSADVQISEVDVNSGEASFENVPSELPERSYVEITLLPQEGKNALVFEGLVIFSNGSYHELNVFLFLD